MNDLWMCCNCESIVALDVHGRCAACGSEAVVRRAVNKVRVLRWLRFEPDKRQKEFDKWQEKLEQNAARAAR